MFKVLDADTVLITWRPPGPDWERAKVGRDGVPARSYEPETTLPYDPWDGHGPEPAWTSAKLGPNAIDLMDDETGRKRTLVLDRATLRLTGDDAQPTGAVPLPGGEEVAVSLGLTPHMALINYKKGKTTLVPLPGTPGNQTVGVFGGALFVVAYEHLCRVDLRSRKVTASPPLQGYWWDEETQQRYHTGFLGAPHHAPSLGGFLVPRPNSGDIALVSDQTLKPVSHIPCGGRPYAVHLFNDGAMVVIDYPFNRFQTAHVDQLKAL